MTSKNVIKFPKKLQVGGFTYDIQYPYEFVDWHDILGLHSGVGGWIRVGNRSVGSGEPKNNQAILEVFIHEILHAVDFVYCGEVLEESDIEMFTRAIYQVLADNKLNFISNGLPKSVKICGIKFKIVDPYKYKDIGEATSHVNYETYSIFIGREINGIKFSDQFIKLTFMNTLLQSILMMYLNDEEIKNLKAKLNINSFASGLYQVLRDNKIEELFSKWIS